MSDSSWICVKLVITAINIVWSRSRRALYFKSQWSHLVPYFEDLIQFQQIATFPHCTVFVSVRPKSGASDALSFLITSAHRLTACSRCFHQLLPVMPRFHEHLSNYFHFSKNTKFCLHSGFYSSTLLVLGVAAKIRLTPNIRRPWQNQAALTKLGPWQQWRE